jgi:hypothetical protein
MKGSIRERSPGHWAIILDQRDPATGKRKWHSFKGTKRQAETERSRLITEMGRRLLCGAFESHSLAVFRTLAEAYQAERLAPHP